MPDNGKAAHGGAGRRASGKAAHGRPRVPSVQELTRRNVETIARIDEAISEKRTAVDRAIDGITTFCGSKVFIWIHAAWYGSWLLINTLAPRGQRFDPYPFDFLTLVVSLEAIFLSTFILITQNRQSRLADLRNHLDLQINLLSEQENTKMLSMLENIERRLGIDDHDPELDVLEQMTRPDKLVDQIESRIERKHARGRKSGK